MSNQLDTLFPQGKEVTVGGKTFTITPFKFGQLPKVIKSLSKAQHTIEEMKLSDGQVDQAAMLTILTECGLDFIIVIADFIGEDKSFVENLEVDEAIVLLTAFFEVNADFFTKRVVPLLTKALAK